MKKYNLYLLWMNFAVLLGWFMTRFILGLLFYIIVSPIGMILRLFGKEFLELKTKTKKSSYWNFKDNASIKSQNYFKTTQN